ARELVEQQRCERVRSEWLRVLLVAGYAHRVCATASQEIVERAQLRRELWASGIISKFLMRKMARKRHRAMLFNAVKLRVAARAYARNTRLVLAQDVLGKRPQGARVLPPHHANAPRPRRGAHAPFPGGEPNRETRGAAAGRRAGDDHAPRGERHGPGRHAPGAGRASSGQGPAQGAVGALPCGARRRGERGGAAASERPQRARGDAQGEGWRSGWHGSEGGQETGGRPGEAAGGAELGESHRPADPAPVFQHGAQRDKQSQQVQVDDQGGAGPSHDHGQAIGRCLGIGEVRANHGSAGRPLAAPLTPRPGALICRRAEGAIGQRDPRVCLSRFGFSEAAGSGAPGALCAPTGDSAGIPERVEER
ncbi:unnamed protein product, partial [Prorocentrum cordatum]